MSIPFFRRKDPQDFKAMRERATIIRSAEVAMPRLHSTWGRAENRAALERIRARRAAEPD
jgi:hypothetical protein